MSNVKVQIPSALRPAVEGHALVEVAAVSVKDAIGSLTIRFPKFAEKMAGPQLQRIMNIYVNDENVKFLDNLDTKLNAGDELVIDLAITGG